MTAIQLDGRVKWFNRDRGFGFIAARRTGRDVFVHVSQLQRAGYSEVLPGMSVLCEAEDGPRGLQCTRILAIDQTTADIPKPDSDWERGIVKWFSAHRGYGFITRGEGTPDIFVHREVLRRLGFTTALQSGQGVDVRWRVKPESNGQPEAVDLRMRG